MNIASFSFCKTRSANILYQIKGVDSAYLIYGSNTIHYEGFLLHDQPDLIIGLGDYSGVDSDRLRIESYCTNSFRNTTVDDLPQIQLELYIPDHIPSNFKIGKGMGNSFCNNVCYKLSKYIQSERIDTKIFFVHIPNRYAQANAVNIISSLLDTIRYILSSGDPI